MPKMTFFKIAMSRTQVSTKSKAAVTLSGQKTMQPLMLCYEMFNFRCGLGLL